MRILITGAAGFIGSHVAEAYAHAGHQVLGVDNLSSGRPQNLPPAIPLEQIDILDEPLVKSLFHRFRPEVISHHAAQVNVRQSSQDPLDDARTNILGGLVVLGQALTSHVKKIIYSSSGGAIYGEAKSMPVTEEHPALPLSNYGVSKYALELYLRSLCATSGPPCVILRYPNIYGPRQDPAGEAGVVSIFTTQLLRGEQPRIFGEGSKTRDYVYISDIVQANVLAMNYNASGVFNLGWGKEISDIEVFETVRAAVGSRIQPIYELKRPGEVDHICLDASRARRLLGWAPKVPFAEGVRNTVAYWRGHP